MVVWLGVGALLAAVEPLACAAQERTWAVHMDVAPGTDGAVVSRLSRDIGAIADARLVESEDAADWVVHVDSWGSGADVAYFLTLREAVRFGDALYAATVSAGRGRFYSSVSRLARDDPEWPAIRDAVVGFEIRDVRVGVAPAGAVDLSGFVAFFDKQCLERSRLNIAQFRAYQEDDSGAVDAIGDRLAALRC